MVQTLNIRIAAVTSSVIAGLFLILTGQPFAQDQAGADPDKKGPRCIIISDIADSIVQNDRLIQISMRSNERISIRLDEGCPQLKFHDFFTFQATGGRLCAERSQVVSRSGETCSILSFDPLDLTALKEDDGSIPE